MNGVGELGLMAMLKMAPNWNSDKNSHMEVQKNGSNMLWLEPLDMQSGRQKTEKKTDKLRLSGRKDQIKVHLRRTTVKRDHKWQLGVPKLFLLWSP